MQAAVVDLGKIELSEEFRIPSVNGGLRLEKCARDRENQCHSVHNLSSAKYGQEEAEKRAKFAEIKAEKLEL